MARKQSARKNVPDGRLRFEDRSGKKPGFGLDAPGTHAEREAPGAEDPEAGWASEQAGSPRRLTTMLLGGTAAALIVMVGVGYFLKGRDGEAITTPESRRPSEGVKTLMETANFVEVRAATTAAVRGFMEARTHAGRCQFVVGGGGVEERMKEFYERPNALVPEGFGALLEVMPAAFGGFAMEAVMASDAKEQVGWYFNVFPLRERMAIDWESSVGYGELSWPKFLRERPTHPVQMRVYLKRVLPVNGGAAELPGHDRYQVSVRAQPEKILCEVPRDSLLADELAKIVPSGASHPVNLQLRWAGSAPDRKVGIVAVLHNFWVDIPRLEDFLRTER